MQVHLDDLLARQGFGPEPEGRLNGGDGAENAIDGLAGVDQRQQNELENSLAGWFLSKRGRRNARRRRR
jgi:hypothetical protein